MRKITRRDAPAEQTGSFDARSFQAAASGGDTPVERLITAIRDVATFWRAPAQGESVAYREYLMLSLGWLGMRLATVFGISFGVNNPFTAMTLHMTHRDLLIFGYICTAIGYALAPLNAYIIDNLHSKDGKYRVFVKLAVPSGVLSLFALFFPYEKLGYAPMVAALFIIGQIQGYVQQWYSTGVSNLVYVISPNSEARVKIKTVSSLVHNFAPSVTGLLIPVLSDVFAGGDLYNIRTCRIVYPGFIVIGVALSLTAYYGVRERISVPRSRTEGISLPDALRAVSRNKLFWIKCSDNWNNFMEDSKNVLMQWLFYYGKVGSMTTYGIMDTLSYNSSMWAMLFSPWLIKRLGKKGFKLTKNILQIFITLGLALTYKKSLAMIFIFYFLNRFWETTEVVDRAIESDIRDYQQYISGERIDGSFGVVDTYVGGAVGAVTNLFIPWIYKRNGFDGTDYSVLNVYDEYGDRKSDSILYSLLDKLLVISLVGAAIDVLPWFFYDLSEPEQRGVARVNRIRSAAEDRAAGLGEDETYCGACEAVFAARAEAGKAPRKTLKKEEAPDRRARRAENRMIREENEAIGAAAFVRRELERYRTDFGAALLAFCRSAKTADPDSLPERAAALPKGADRSERALRSDAVRMAREARRTAKKAEPRPTDPFDPAAFDALFSLPEDTPAQRKEKNRAIRAGKRDRRRRNARYKPYLWMERHCLLAEVYEDLDSFTADYPEAKRRLEERRTAEARAAAEARARRRAEAEARKRKS